MNLLILQFIIPACHAGDRVRSPATAYLFFVYTNNNAEKGIKNTSFSISSKLYKILFHSIDL
ncbi:hypothetical protein Hanom_Chr02g00161501 [Helianthus anomalus]